jgi:uncharacterized circularly permuted ATP-grasp superfamily protein
MHGGYGTSGRTAAAVGPEHEAIEAYDASLGRGDVARRTYLALSDAQQAHRVLVGGRPLCSVLRPRFLARSHADHLASVSALVARVLERAGGALLASERALDLIGASEQEREIWAIDPGYPGFTLTSRLDSFTVDGRPRFIEYNAESPAGIGYCDRLFSLFSMLPAVQHWTQRFAVARVEGCRHLLDALLWAYHERGGRGIPSVAVIDWEDVITRRDFELCAEYFRTQAIPTVIVDPRALEYRNGRVWAGNEPITLVYRRVLLHELLARADEAAPLLRAYRDGAVCMVNSPRSKLLHKKSVFALLSEGALGVALTPEEQAAIDATIPWTRLVVPGPTVYDGHSEDLLALLLRHQERFALKPVDDYGGKGVVLGWTSARSAWEASVEHALRGGYVVQQRVAVPEEPFPVWQDDRLAYVNLLLDTDPLLFRGAMGSILTRLSGSALLNVSAGTGSSVPTFVVEEL